ncbi:protein kinase [Planctomycetota bacterium]
MLEKLGQYTIEEELFEGPKGAVYRARDPGGNLLALKVLHRDVMRNKEYRGRFLREMAVALTLDHPNIVRALNAGEADGRLYLATELVEGGDLREVVEERGRIDEVEALRLVRSVLEALGHAHRHGLIHRDVKPANVLLTLRGVPKLADLGLVRGRGSGAAQFTDSGETLGTPSYLSPEQARGQKDLDIRCDLYAVGATLFHLLTGRPPFCGRNIESTLEAHLFEPAPDPGERCPDLSLGVRRLVTDLLQKDRNQRPADPNAVIGRIDLLLAESRTARPSDGSSAKDASANRELSAYPDDEPIPLVIRIRLLDGPEAGRDRTFAKSPIRIGRDTSSDVVLSGEGAEAVDEHHCELFLASGALHVRDLQSAGGTYLNDECVQVATALRTGDHVRAGKSGPKLLVEIAADTMETARVPSIRKGAPATAEAAQEQAADPAGREPVTEPWYRSTAWLVLALVLALALVAALVMLILLME